MIPKRRTALLSEISDMLAACESRRQVPTLKLAGLIGHLNFLRFQSSETALHLMALDLIKVGAVRRAGWNSYALMHPGASGDLRWWIHVVTSNVPRPWEPPPHRATLTTDASPSGWGAELRVGSSRIFGYGAWTVFQKSMTSNAKELSAVRGALGVFSRKLRGMTPATIIVESDNTTAVHVINNKRAAPTLCPMLRTLLNYVQRMRLHLKAIYTPAGTYVDACFLSCP
jgi:hypothetical protein